MSTVLLVDDAADIRFLASTVLAGAGFEVTETESGEQALDVLAHGLAPDLVLLDVQMPDMDGRETLRAIRADPRTADLRVVFCTVKGRPEDTLEGWEAGCDGYISKPFNVGHLAEEVRQIVERSADERQRARAIAIDAAREAAAASRA